MRILFIGAAALLTPSIPAEAVAAPFGAARTLSGAPFNSAGHVTIVNYWATWCAPCRAEMPVLDAFYRRHSREGLALIAISIDEGVSASRLRELTAKFAFPVARIDDVKIPRRDIPKALPVTRIYDRRGNLVFQTRGDGRTVIDAATLDRVVSPLLASP